MDEIVTRIYHLNSVEGVVLKNVEYFRDVLGRSALEMGMLEDWTDRLSTTELRKAFNEQEARIAAAIAEGKAPAPRNRSSRCLGHQRTARPRKASRGSFDAAGECLLSGRSRPCSRFSNGGSGSAALLGVEIAPPDRCSLTPA